MAEGVVPALRKRLVDPDTGREFHLHPGARISGTVAALWGLLVLTAVGVWQVAMASAKLDQLVIEREKDGERLERLEDTTRTLSENQRMIARIVEKLEAK